MMQNLPGLKKLIPALFTVVEEIRKLIGTSCLRKRALSSHCSLHELYLLTVLRTAMLLAAEALPQAGWEMPCSSFSSAPPLADST